MSAYKVAVKSLMLQGLQFFKFNPFVTECGFVMVRFF